MKYVILPLLALCLVLFLGLVLHVTYQKGQIATRFEITRPPGIQEATSLELGGVEQWVFIRGEDVTHPILLFLHGGPGSPETPAMRNYVSALEDHFVVVNWDQRGSGKSCCGTIPPETMNMEQFVQDTLELTQWLREHFNRDKIYLVGHSWGSMIGTSAAQRHPELYHAYVGIGQAVSFYEGEKISYQYTLEQAREQDNEVALQELLEIGEPPYSREDFLQHIGVQRKWLFEFGGMLYEDQSQLAYNLGIARDFLYAPEYSLAESVNILRGPDPSVYSLLWDDMRAIDFISDIPRLDLPVFFLVGRHDWVTVFPLVEEYYDILEAPHKELLWFDHSGHNPHYEETDRFVRLMVERVLHQTYPDANK